MQQQTSSHIEFILYKLLACSIITLLASCTEPFSTSNSYIQRLQNRGIVPLSADNPYIAANALLNKEMQNSQELKGFISHRGAPEAISIENYMFSSLKINMYYPANNEYFIAEQIKATWVISGPLPIDSDKLAEIKKIGIFKQGKRKIMLPAPDTNPAPTSIPATAATITAQPAPSPVITSAPVAATLPAVVTPKLPESSSPGNIRELVMKYGKTMAEVSPKGDVVHYVSYPGETVPMITRWYTFDISNQQKIIRINHLTDKIPVPGDSIIIPGYLVKNKYIMNEEALSALEKAVSEGEIK